MPKQIPTLNQTDIQTLKKVFATKGDLDKKFKPINRNLKEIRGALNHSLKRSEPKEKTQDKRVDRLEDHLNLPPLS